MKKWMSCILSVLLAAGLFLMPVQANAASASSQAGVVSVSSGSLNVRSSAATSSDVITSLPKGSYVTLISRSSSWWQVEYAAGKYGYCHADYIRAVSSYAARVKTQWGNLNVRSGAGTNHSKVGSLSSGTTVVVLSSANGWSRILYNGTKTGYVSSQYLSASVSYPAVSLSVPNYKQTDSRWASVKIGSSGKTIGQIGCTTTGIAMMESYRTGTAVYPDAMSRRLSYDSYGNLYWPADYTAVTNGTNYLSGIYAQLQQGKPVLIGAKNSYGSQHWVVVTGYTGGSTLTASGFTINDPGSNSRTNLQQFLNSYSGFYKYLYY